VAATVSLGDGAVHVLDDVLNTQALGFFAADAGGLLLGGRYTENQLVHQAQVYTHFAHVDELRTKLNARKQSWALNYTIEQQFLCHVAGNNFEPGTYNLESWRPGVPWGVQLNPVTRCNP
jgi:hypothetical protein